MAYVEVARRIKRLGIGVALCGVLFSFPLWVADLSVNKVGYGDIFAMILSALMLGGIIYAAGRIVEGFLYSPHSRR